MIKYMINKNKSLNSFIFIYRIIKCRIEKYTSGTDASLPTQYVTCDSI